MKRTKVFALIAIIFATISCSNVGKETMIPDFTQYPLCKESNSIVFVDIKKGEVVSRKYYEAFPFYNGLAVVRTSKGWTYVNEKFEEPIPDYYLDATHFSEGVAFTVKRGGKISAINENGEVLYTLSNVESIYALSEDRAVFRGENNKFGILDKNGEIICTPKFDECEKLVKDGALLVMQKGSKPKWGIVDCNGEILIPIKYPKIIRSEKGFTIFNDSRKAAWYDLESNTVTDFDFYDIIRDGKYLCYKNSKGKYGWMTMKGIEVIAPTFDEVTLFGKDDITFVKMKRKAKEWGAINKDSEWVIGPRYSTVTKTDKYPIIGNAHKEYGVVDFDGTVLIKTNKSAIKHIEGEYYLVTDYKGRTGIMKADGKEQWVGKPIYQPSARVAYRPSIMVSNDHIDLEAICGFISKESSKFKKTTVSELLEAYNINKDNLPKKTGNIVLAEHDEKSYSIKVETDKVSAWSYKRDYWSGNVLSYNGISIVKKYLVTVTLKSRYAKNKAEILERIKQEFGLDDDGVLKTDERSYKLIDSSNKKQTSFKISITIEE